MTTKTESYEALSTEGLIKTGVKKLAHTVKAETIASVNKDAVIEQLVAENAELKGAITGHYHSTHQCLKYGDADPSNTDDVCSVLDKTSVTDSVIRELQANAIEEAAKNVVISYYEMFDNGLADKIIELYEKAFLDYAKALRSGEV